MYANTGTGGVSCSIGFRTSPCGDSVVVEGEFGDVEEINLTHVIIKVWDLHRLVLPVNYFVEKPFENWTRGSSDVLGTVMIRADFSVPVQDIREELNRRSHDGGVLGMRRGLPVVGGG